MAVVKEVLAGMATLIVKSGLIVIDSRLARVDLANRTGPIVGIVIVVELGIISAIL